MNRLFYIMMGLSFLFGCGRSDNESVDRIIPPKQMQLVLFDVIKADAFDTEVSFKKKDFKDTTDNIERQNAIFKHHKVTRAAFKKSMDYYKKNPDLFIPVLDSMLTQQETPKKTNLLNFKVQ